jgi:hypothetical protein
MRRILAFAVCGCLMTAGTGLRAQGSDAEPVSLDLLLIRGGEYLRTFLEKFSNVVAEETYVQDSSVPMQSAAVIGRTGAFAFGTSKSRVLKSDFLLANVNAGENLVPFRDVFEVDGQTVRDRDSRLQRLFLKPSADMMEQINRIQVESARYNLGNMLRTVNNPLLGVVFLQIDSQPRFNYVLGKPDPKVGPGVWVVDYTEEESPTLVRGSGNLDLFARGRLWVEAQTGRLMKTEILLDQPNLHARLTTSFRFDDRFGIAVPYEMQEEYKFDSGTRVTASATYDRFRRFDVSTEETITDEKFKDKKPTDEKVKE